MFSLLEQSQVPEMFHGGFWGADVDFGGSQPPKRAPSPGQQRRDNGTRGTFELGTAPALPPFPSFPRKQRIRCIN